VHDAVVVRELQRLADRRHDGQRLLGRQAARLHRLAQVDAVDVLHQQEIELAGPAEVVHRDDIRVAELGQGLALPREPLGEAGVGRVLGGEDLERHEPGERLLAGLVDGPHPAVADELDQLQVREVRGQLAHRPGGPTARRRSCPRRSPAPPA
jgi:hypothetical protein